MTEQMMTCSDCSNHHSAGETSRSCECMAHLYSCHTVLYCDRGKSEPRDARGCAGFQYQEKADA